MVETSFGGPPEANSESSVASTLVVTTKAAPVEGPNEVGPKLLSEVDLESSVVSTFVVTAKAAPVERPSRVDLDRAAHSGLVATSEVGPSEAPPELWFSSGRQEL